LVDYRYAVLRPFFPRRAALASKGGQDPHIVAKSMVGPLSYLLGAAVAWLSSHAAFVIYMLTPLFFIVPPKWHGIRE